MAKATIKITKKNSNLFEIKFSGLTQGEVLALKHAVQNWGENGSAVGQDVYQYLANAEVEKTVKDFFF